MMDWFYEHNIFKCQNVQTAVVWFEHLFSWNEWLYQFVSSHLEYLGIKRDCDEPKESKTESESEDFKAEPIQFDADTDEKEVDADEVPEVVADSTE